MSDIPNQNRRRTDPRVEPVSVNRDVDDESSNGDSPRTSAATHEALPLGKTARDGVGDSVREDVHEGLHENRGAADPRTIEPRPIGTRPGGPREPSLGELVSSLSDDLSTLLRKEVELATAEIQENVKDAARAGTMVAIGGFLGYAGLILLLIAASILLGTLLDSLWLGTAIVGLIVVVIAGILYASGKSKLADVSLAPRKAIKSVERDIDMAKEKLS